MTFCGNLLSWSACDRKADMAVALHMSAYAKADIRSPLTGVAV